MWIFFKEYFNLKVNNHGVKQISCNSFTSELFYCFFQAFTQIKLTQKNLFINESICFGKLISFCWQKIQTNIYEKIKPKDDSWFIIK